MKAVRKIPLGLSNFETIRTENYVYVDKTRFIEMMENEPAKYRFFLFERSC